MSPSSIVCKHFFSSRKQCRLTEGCVCHIILEISIMKWVSIILLCNTTIVFSLRCDHLENDYWTCQNNHCVHYLAWKNILGWMQGKLIFIANAMRLNSHLLHRSTDYLSVVLWKFYIGKKINWIVLRFWNNCDNIPDSKVHGANMGPTWILSAPDGPHMGPMNLAIRIYLSSF